MYVSEFSWAMKVWAASLSPGLAGEKDGFFRSATLTSSRLDLNVPLAIHQLGQGAAQAERRLAGRRLFAAVEDALVLVLLGQARQAIDVQVDLFGVFGF